MEMFSWFPTRANEAFPNLHALRAPQEAIVEETRSLAFISVTVTGFTASQAFHCFPSDDMIGIQPISSQRSPGLN